MNPRIVALGSVNVDVEIRADRWPEPGETLLGRDFLMIGGGKAANVAWLARHLGLDAQLIAHIGNDSLQETALRFLREAGVDLSRVRTLDNHHTGVSVIIVQPNGRKGILLASNANEVWNEEDKEWLQKTIERVPAGSLLATNLEIPVAMVKHAIQCAKSRGLPVVLDPSPADRLDQELLESGSYLTPNHSEAQRITNSTIDTPDQALEAANSLLAFGSPGVCVKLKDGGCAIASPQEHQIIPSPTMEVSDTTGAGDAFAGALSIALLEKQSLVYAARFAVATAAFAVTGYGSHTSYPSRFQIEDLMNQSERKE